MNKYELAQYLVNLHTLMEAQDAAGLQKSKAVAEEYTRTWGQLKQEIENGRQA